MNEKNGAGGKAAGFAEDKGFYIILMLCALAIGISGYVLFFTPQTEEAQGPGMGELIMPSSGEKTPDYIPKIPEVTVKTEEEDKPKKQEEKPKPAEKKKKQEAAEVWVFKKPAEYLMPVSGEIIRGFSGDKLIYDRTMGDWRTHEGIDISCAEGDEVMAISAGKVEKISSDGLSGTTVIISHEGDLKSIYSGLAEDTAVSEGDKVKAGDIIGKAACNIKSESLMEPHIHLAVTEKGKYKDPEGLKLR